MAGKAGLSGVMSTGSCAARRNHAGTGHHPLCQRAPRRCFRQNRSAASRRCTRADPRAASRPPAAPAGARPKASTHPQLEARGQQQHALEHELRAARGAVHGADDARAPPGDGHGHGAAAVDDEEACVASSATVSQHRWLGLECPGGVARHTGAPAHDTATLCSDSLIHLWNSGGSDFSSTGRSTAHTAQRKGQQTLADRPSGTQAPASPD